MRLTVTWWTEPISRRFSSYPRKQERSDIFRREQLHIRPSMIVCRHVLEHIFDLPRFLHEIRFTLSSWLPVPFFFEVPDMDWIVNQQAFWDFCYEHCNYFTPNSIRACLQMNGFEVKKISPAYGGQYLWIEGLVSEDKPVKSAQDSGVDLLIQRLLSYSSQEQKNIDQARAFLQRKEQEKRHIVVWRRPPPRNHAAWLAT